MTVVGKLLLINGLSVLIFILEFFFRKVESLIKDFNTNTHQFQSLMIRTMCTTIDIQKQSRLLLQDTDALVKITSESHEIKCKEFDNARSLLRDKSVSAMEMHTSLHRRAYEISDTEAATNVFHAALHQNISAFQDFVRACQETHKTLEEYGKAYQEHLLAREEYTKVSKLNHLVKKLHRYSSTLAENATKLLVNKSELLSEADRLRDCMAAFLDQCRGLTTSQRASVEKDCVLTEGTRNLLLLERSIMDNECDELLISRELIDTMVENMAKSSSQIMKLVHQEYKSECLRWQSEWDAIETHREQYKSVREASSKAFEEYKQARELYLRILPSGLQSGCNCDKGTENCVICNEVLAHGQSLIKWTKCFHVYHYDCILDWISKSIIPTCPLCREALLQ